MTSRSGGGRGGRRKQRSGCVLGGTAKQRWRKVQETHRKGKNLRKQRKGDAQLLLGKMLRMELETGSKDVMTTLTKLSVLSAV
jgi:hypothetical protein